MKRLKLLMILTFFITENSLARDTCYVGIYLKALYNLSPSGFSFGTDFYIWNNSFDSVQLFRKVELMNSKNLNVLSEFTERDGSRYVSYLNCKAELSHDWDLKYYPFDRQKLAIKLEAQESMDYIVMEQDYNGFKVDKNLVIPGWNIEGESYCTLDSEIYYCNPAF